MTQNLIIPWLESMLLKSGRLGRRVHWVVGQRHVSQETWRSYQKHIAKNAKYWPGTSLPDFGSTYISSRVDLFFRHYFDIIRKAHRPASQIFSNDHPSLGAISDCLYNQRVLPDQRNTCLVLALSRVFKV